MEELIFKVVDPIQEFIMRRLLGELQEVKTNNSYSVNNNSCYMQCGLVLIL